jgi:hypothetical protein
MNSPAGVLLAKKAQTPEEIVELFLSLIVVWCGWKLAEYAYGLLPAWWLRNEKQGTESELVMQFPKKAWVAFSFRILFCVFAFASMALVALAATTARSLTVLHILPLGAAFMAGGACSGGLVELLAGVSPMMSLSRRTPPPYARQDTLDRWHEQATVRRQGLFTVSAKAHWVGLYRFGLAALLFTLLFALG